MQMKLFPVRTQALRLPALVLVCLLLVLGALLTSKPLCQALPVLQWAPLQLVCPKMTWWLSTTLKRVMAKMANITTTKRLSPPKSTRKTTR